MNEISKLDVSVFEKIKIEMSGAELKTVLGEWFAQIIETIRKEVETQYKKETDLTAEETSEMLGVDKSTLWRWDKCGYLPKVKVGSKVRYRLTDVESLMKKG